jgi:hypothetical protein
MVGISGVLTFESLFHGGGVQITHIVESFMPPEAPHAYQIEKHGWY